MKNVKKLLATLFVSVLATSNAEAKDPTCDGRWVNPITDICWKCIFPMSIGNVKVASGSLPDTRNPSSPLQFCPAPPPIFQRLGLAIGFWEPFAMTDVTRAPGCMVNMGGFTIPIPKAGTGAGTKVAGEHPGTFYHVHWYKYPVISWLNIITSVGCMQGGEYDIAYLSELDPMWKDDQLALFTNPETIVFANPVAQLACMADAVAAETGMPLDPLFWCSGGHGSMYPFTGNLVNESSGLNSGILLTDRMNFKLHRQGMIWDTVGENGAVCSEYPTVIMPKSRYRYQMVNTIPDANQCHPLGRSVMGWQTGKELPTSKKNYGYLIWKKRNCVVL
ncbi:conjugal transfer pilus assembly protein TraU [Serratia sp. UGAL515B_01]|uniref:conjugal transfer pilus assembly protein TraU n=1 Tax=Serratia sp. UGAL515B_01 TaxID=2986763 RepID=UPI0029537BB7|nr:conjugal transfer pilus assembly protein TraU [Serratia sp. UGAL515B_01]WON75530.1 conjugal transfer pilus assembly protein TraU [Serratia sp. UGAL515B_01]